jgi:calcineurin-like phosphoesterase family protein
MANLYLTADFHLGHANVIRYENRPFKTIDEMDNEIIHRANERVKEDDTCIHVGDFCFRNSPGGKEGEGTLNRAKNYYKRLNGHWILIKGNHDRNNGVDTKIKRLVLNIGGMDINVCHNPLDAKYNYILNLVGHVHSKWLVQSLQKYYDKTLLFFQSKPKEEIKHYAAIENFLYKNKSVDKTRTCIINVGCDNNKFYPYHFDEIKSIWDKWLHNNKNRKDIQRCLLTQSQKNK